MEDTSKTDLISFKRHHIFKRILMPLQRSFSIIMSRWNALSEYNVYTHSSFVLMNIWWNATCVLLLIANIDYLIVLIIEPLHWYFYRQ